MIENNKKFSVQKSDRAGFYSKNTSSGQAAVTRTVSRGAAIRAQKRNAEMANKIASDYLDASATKLEKRANVIDNNPRLKIIGLGGMDGGGSKNTILIEYLNDAIIIDAGNDLGVDLPGINYGIADTSYLESIRNKLKGYVITHGHLDHIGALPHIIPKIPAPVYGSKFTIGRVEEIFQNYGLPMPEGFELKTVVVNENTHERLKVGSFFIEFVRVTHSIPGSTSVVVDTPVGRVFVSGDFRLDPQPLDHERTDMERLNQLGREGVLVMLSESTTTERAGRTPSDSLEPGARPGGGDQFRQGESLGPGAAFVAQLSLRERRLAGDGPDDAGFPSAAGRRTGGYPGRAAGTRRRRRVALRRRRSRRFDLTRTIPWCAPSWPPSEGRASSPALCSRPAPRI